MDTSDAKTVPELVDHDKAVDSQVRQLTTGIKHIAPVILFLLEIMQLKLSFRLYDRAIPRRWLSI